MTEQEKVIKTLEYCIKNDCNESCPYKDKDWILRGLATCRAFADGETVEAPKMLMDDALALLKAQNEVIEALMKVGYPHNFQREEPWIVNYMYAITDVVKKAVNLKNGQ